MSCSIEIQDCSLLQLRLFGYTAQWSSIKIPLQHVSLYSSLYILCSWHCMACQPLYSATGHTWSRKQRKESKPNQEQLYLCRSAYPCLHILYLPWRMKSWNFFSTFIVYWSFDKPIGYLGFFMEVQIEVYYQVYRLPLWFVVFHENTSKITRTYETTLDPVIRVKIHPTPPL